MCPFSPESLEEKIGRHVAFLERRNTDRPLLGCIRGWENLSRYVEDTESFFPRGEVYMQDLSCDRFRAMFETCAETLDEGDDLFRTLEPLPFFPWAEAAVGCPITYTGKNFWSSPLAGMTTPEQIQNWIEAIPEQESLCSEKVDPGANKIIPAVPNGGVPDSSSRWLAKYEEILGYLTDQFSDRHPVGQSILRGPLDMAAAVFGDENMIYHFYDHPSLMKAFLSVATSVFLDFVYIQNLITPPFRTGSVIGSYYIWTPGSCVRLQEDAMALLSPDLYREFVHPLDRVIASTVEFSLFHLHSSGLHLIDVLLENEELQILQVSKDQGVNLEKMLPDLQKIQAAGKCLIVKGRLNNSDVQVLKRTLDYSGLCIQAVVLDQKEADDFYAAF